MSAKGLTEEEIVARAERRARRLFLAKVLILVVGLIAALGSARIFLSL